MRQNYEKACKEEGLGYRKTRDIAQVFDTQYKQMKREIEYREEHGIVINSLSAMGVTDEDSDGAVEYEIPDSSGDPLVRLIASEDEKEMEKKMALLQEVLDETDPDDREILLTYYGGSYGIESKMARDLGMDRKAFIRLRKRLLNEMRERFMERWDE